MSQVNCEIWLSQNSSGYILNSTPCKNSKKKEEKSKKSAKQTPKPPTPPEVAPVAKVPSKNSIKREPIPPPQSSRDVTTITASTLKELEDKYSKRNHQLTKVYEREI